MVSENAAWGRGFRLLVLGGLVGAAAHPALPPVVVATVEVSESGFRALPRGAEFESLIREASETHGVDPDLVRAVIRAESEFDPQARSRAGAQGLMQLMPALSRELGVTDPYDPRQNVFGGVRYLSRLLQRHQGDVGLAVASYNAGPTRVSRYKGIPPFPETRGYVRKVRRLLVQAGQGSRQVAMTRPGD
jgi:soluble lytic murein transglycosylase-like protein